MASLGSIFVKLGLDTKPFDRGLEKASRNSKRKVAGMTAAFRNLRVAIGGIGSAIAIGAGVRKSIRVAADYQAALTGVVKTTGLAGAELKDLEDRLKGISRRFAVTNQELLGLAEAAGQMGVEGSKNLARFAETMAKMAVASDVAGEEGGKAIVRLLTITGEGVETIDRFGSALVGLGNNAAASESEILHMATFVGQSIASFDVSAAEVLGLSAAMKSMGLRAESAGSAVGRAFRKLAATNKEFSSAPAETFIAFLEDLQREGDNATTVLAEMGLKGDENAKVFPVLAQNVHLVKEALSLSNNEWRTNNALMSEAAQFNATYAAKLKIFNNNIIALQRNIGEGLLPALTEILETINFVFDQGERKVEIAMNTIGAVVIDATNGITTAFVTMLAGVVAGVSKAAKEIVEIFTDAFDEIIKGLEFAANKFSEVISFISRGTINLGETNLDAFKFKYDAASFSKDFNTVFNALGGNREIPNVFQNRLEELVNDGIADSRGGGGTSAGGSTTTTTPLAQIAEDAGEAAKEVTKLGGSLGKASGSAKKLNEGITTIPAKLTDMQLAINDTREELNRFGRQTFENLSGFIVDWAETGKLKFKEFATSAIAELARIQLKAIATRAILGLANSGGTIGSIFGGIAGAFGLSGQRRLGGPVQAGRSYLVGEDGPEILNMGSSSGNVISNADIVSGNAGGGAGIVLHQENSFHGDADETKMARWAERSAQWAVEGISELIQNGGNAARQFAQ